MSDYPAAAHPVRLEDDLDQDQQAIDAASANAPGDEASRGEGRSPGGRVALILLGVAAGLTAFALLVSGGALIAVDLTQRDEAGYMMSPSERFSTATFALVSEKAQLDTDGAERAIDSLLGDARVRAQSDQQIFVGVGRAAAVERYLAGVEHERVTGFEDSEPTYAHHAGGAPLAAPAEQTFWDASTSGVGEQKLDWNVREGEWRVVVMNADATPGIDAEMSIGAELDSLPAIGAGLVLAGLLLAVGAAVAIGFGARQGTDA